MAESDGAKASHWEGARLCRGIPSSSGNRQQQQICIGQNEI